MMLTRALACAPVTAAGDERLMAGQVAPHSSLVRVAIHPETPAAALGQCHTCNRCT
jgi:hypothetical protein